MDTHLKTWFSVIASSVVIISAVAFTYTSQTKYYRGLEIIEDEITLMPHKKIISHPASGAMISEIIAANKKHLSQLQSSIGKVAQASVLTAKVEEKKSALAPATTVTMLPKPVVVVLATTRVVSVRASSPKTIMQKSLHLPTPKIKVVQEVAPSGRINSLASLRLGLQEKTCESEGRVTYSGKDIPGLLYGMCTQK